jgi:hypothetical protein
VAHAVEGVVEYAEVLWLVRRRSTSYDLVMMMMMMNEGNKQIMLYMIIVGDFTGCILCIEMIKSISIVQDALFSIIKLNK